MTTPTFVELEGLDRVRSRSEVLKKDREHHLCPGCGEGIALRVIANVLTDMGAKDDCILVKGVGCYTEASIMLDVDNIWALHGRAPAMATGIKRSRPGPLVFTIQGDGDLHGEGVLEAVQAAARGELITIICFNNAVNAETGSQMTPATIPGMKTNTTRGGRDVKEHGFPLRMAELLGGIEGAAFVARSAVHTPAEIQRATAYIATAFDVQRRGLGFSFVELLTMCPSGWHMSALEALDFVERDLSHYHPLGVIKDDSRLPS
jgi:2-oxoglutarate/2-oxoacid ferredoxin oxidoreductase subunit beta